MRLGIAALAVALALAGAATAAPAHGGRIAITFYTANVRGRDVAPAVRVSGAIDAVGAETQTEKPRPGGELNVATLHLAAGTIRLVAPEQFAWKPDVRSCTATASGGGTFTITGGTGAYRGATGKGTFTSTGVALGARSAGGACLPRAMPAANYVIVAARGTIALP